MFVSLTRRVLAFVAALALAACTGAATPSAPSPAATGGDPAACAAAGGAIRPVCRMQRPMCVIPYADAGKVCTDDKQCGGGCIYEGAPTGPDGVTTGVCRKDNDPCGCVTHVTGGKQSGGVCVD